MVNYTIVWEGIVTIGDRILILRILSNGKENIIECQDGKDKLGSLRWREVFQLYAK